jgi:hypothetical protein
MTKISHTRLKCYNECSQKFFYKYVKKLESPEINSPLLFGVAIDEALNYLLECERDGVPYTMDQVYECFNGYMMNWGQFEVLYNPDVVYSLGDIDYYLLSDEDVMHFSQTDPDFPDTVKMTQDKQRDYTKWFRATHPEEFGYLAWRSLYNKGILMLDTFKAEILPKFAKILDVQVDYRIDNGDGDILTVKMDFVAEMPDGKVVVFDNKTSSTAYPKDAVETSPQLATYLEFWDTRYAGYIVLEKKIRKDKRLRYQFMINEIPEEFTKKVFDDFSEGLYNIKEEIYERNTDACRSYGRLCEFYDLCHNNEIGNLREIIYREKK